MLVTSRLSCRLTYSSVSPFETPTLPSHAVPDQRDDRPGHRISNLKSTDPDRCLHILFQSVSLVRPRYGNQDVHLPSDDGKMELHRLDSIYQDSHRTALVSCECET